MNLKRCLRAVQAFYAATPPIDPTLKICPCNLSYSAMHNSAHLLKITQGCLAEVINTAQEPKPSSCMSSGAISSEFFNDRLAKTGLGVDRDLQIRFFRLIGFIITPGLGRLGIHYGD